MKRPEHAQATDAGRAVTADAGPLGAAPPTVSSPWRRDRVLWLLLLGALAVRLINVDAPLIGRHAWRQADTAAIARNFQEHGYDFARPQIDHGGASDGYCEMEAPIYPYAVAVFYGLTGVWEGWGRLLSALCSLVGIVFMYRLVRWTSGRQAALWTVAYLAILPLFAFYSRTFQPEAMMLMGSAVGVTAFATWTRTGAWRWWWLALATISLACLVKITALYLGLPLAWLAWRESGWRMLRRPSIWAFAAGVCTVVALWYAHAYRLGQEGGNSFSIWTYGWGSWGLVVTWKFWNQVLFRYLVELHLTWPALPLVVAGLILPRHRPEERLYDWWLLAVLIYFLLIRGNNFVHEYYQLPAILPLAAVLGRVTARGLARGTRWPLSLATALAVALVLADSAGKYAGFMRMEDPERSWEIALARMVRAGTSPDERGIAFDGESPLLLYLADRKGWAVDGSQVTPDELRAMVADGARFLTGRADGLPSWLQVQYGVHDEQLVFERLSAPPPDGLETN